MGKNLINAAGQRALISQIEKYKTAVNTFRVKYNYLPGDLPAYQAPQLGFASRSGGAAHGDGSGIIECTSLTWAGRGAPLGGECVLVWDDLSSAGLIEGGYTNGDCEPTFSGGAGNCPTTSTPTALVAPTAAFASVGVTAPLIHAFGDTTQSRNYFLIIADVFPLGGYAEPQEANGTPSTSYTYTFNSADAAAIDGKVDDGMPQSGKVLARQWPAGHWIYVLPALANSYGSCLTTAGGPYGKSTTPCAYLSFEW